MACSARVPSPIVWANGKCLLLSMGDGEKLHHELTARQLWGICAERRRLHEVCPGGRGLVQVCAGKGQQPPPPAWPWGNGSAARPSGALPCTKPLLCSGCSRDPRKNKALPGAGWAAGPGQGEAVPSAMGRGVPTGASAGAAPPASASSLRAGCCPGGLCKRQMDTSSGTRGSQGQWSCRGHNPAAAALQRLSGSRQGSSHSWQEQALAPGMLTPAAARARHPEAQGWPRGAGGTQPRALLAMEQLWGFTPLLAEQLGLGCT